ncbi:hypothetical protein QTN25_004894 [Entamoeba marina]
MTDTPILNYSCNDEDSKDCDHLPDNSDTPDFSEISIDENDPNPTNNPSEISIGENYINSTNGFANILNGPRHDEYQSCTTNENPPIKYDGKFQSDVNFNNLDDLDGVDLGDVDSSDDYPDNSPSKSEKSENPYIKTIADENDPNNYEEHEDGNHTKQQEEPNKQELQKQLQKLKKQLSEKEDKREQFEKLQKKEQEQARQIGNLQKQLQKKERDIKPSEDTQEKEQKLKRQFQEKEQEHLQQIKYLQEALKEAKTDIMNEIGDRKVDRNENIDLNVQLKDFIDYCKKEISARIEFIEELNISLMQKAEDVEFYRNNGNQHTTHNDQLHNLTNSIKGEIEKLKQINNNLMEENEQLKRQSGTNQVKDEEIKKLKQENNDLIRQMKEELNEKEKEIEEINVNKIKGSCEEEKVGEMIKTMTQRKLLTFTNELTKSRHSSQLSQQLILNSSSFIIPITIFEFYNGCTKMITIPINGNNILNKVIIDKCDNHLIKTICGKTIIIEVQQHNHITYDRGNNIAIFMIKRSEISQDIQIRHPCGTYFDKPKDGINNLKYKGTDGTEIEIRIVDDNKFSEEMKRYYDILNGVKQQKHAKLEEKKEVCIHHKYIYINI